ncbi:hypothetical protein GH714_002110 [Hevea brasiliensis]|uniref:Uncharacterized protein n=1 Tax=Hevea brasiliensis TaxID=3981 RepID=A0A6A6MA77_HEVBR|nr:hypothetical protein GH714_002110 [Hevea brasiliensis]
MPSSDIPSKILCQVIKIDLQDMQQQTPCQQLIPKDLHGNEWHFQHVNQSELPSKARRTKISSTSNSCHGGFPVIISITMQPRDQISKAGDISASFTDSGDMYKGVPRKCTGKRISLNCLRQALLPSQNPQSWLKILLMRRENKDIGRLKGERIYYQRRLHSKRWGNNVGRYGQEDKAVGSLPQALPANPVHGERIQVIMDDQRE